MVFENILVRVLNQKVGRYIEGLDSKNLEVGVFSGSVVIENVKLKSSLPELLELPFDLKYSHIKKLILKIPFTNLSGAPVEIELDGLYALFDVKREADWMQDCQSLKAKLENVEQYAQDILEKMMQVQQKQMDPNQKSGDEGSKTYVERLLIKILDNIQLKISNIHVRVENQIGQKFSFGACLQSIGMFTINERDERAFIDRTKPSNQKLAMIKKLELNNLGVYINPNEQRFLTMKSFEEIQQNMSYSIMKTGLSMNNVINYLFSINLQAKFVQNPKGDFKEPEQVVVIDMNSLNITLDQAQLQQIIFIIEHLNAYSKHISKLKESQCTNDESQQKALIVVFKDAFPKYLYKLDRNLEGMVSDQRKGFQEAIEKLPIKILLDQTKVLVAEELKSRQVNKIKPPKKGIFSRIFGGGSSEQQNQLITSKEKEKIEQFFQSLVKQEDSLIQEQATTTTITAPDDYTWLKIKIQFEGGCVHLKKQCQTMEFKGVSFSFQDLKGSMNVKNKGNNVTVSLRELNMDIVEEQIIRREKKIINVLGKSMYSQEKNIIFFRLDTKELADGVERSVKFNLAQAKFQYSTLLVQLLSEFFEVQVQDQELRDSALKKIEEFQEKTQQQVEESIKNIDKSKDSLKLDIFLASPIIVLPLAANVNALLTDCLMIQLGNFGICTDLEEENKQVTIQEQEFKNKDLKECYSLSLQNISCRYFTSIETMELFLQQNYYQISASGLDMKISQKLLNSSQNLPERNSVQNQLKEMKQKGEMFTLLHDFSILILIQVSKYHQQKLFKIDSLPKISLEGQVSDLKINLNPKIYLKLLSLKDVLSPSPDQKKQSNLMTSEQYEKNHIEEVITEKKELLKKSIKVGFLFKRGKHIKKWEKFYGVLTRDHIYFFEIQNSIQPTSHVAIKYATINSIAEDQCGFKNAFMVRNRYEDIYLGCEKQENTEKWIQMIQKIHQENMEEKKLYEIQQNENDEQQKASTVDYENTNLEQVELKMSFCASTLTVILEGSEQNLIAELIVQKFSMKAEKKLASLSALLTLEGIYLNDYIYKFQDPALTYLITSQNECNDQLINIKLNMIDKNHPNYQNIDLDADLEFGCLFINFKPDTILQIMDFFRIDTEGHIIRQLEIQKQELQRKEDETFKTMQKQTGGDKLQQLTGIEQANQTGMRLVPGNLIDNKETILIKVKMHIKQIALNIVHRKIKLNQAQLSLQSSQIEFILKAEEMQISGSLQNLQIFDLTNYPNTVYKEEQYTFQRKQEMVGLWYDENEILTHIDNATPKINDKKKNLLSFTVLMLEPTSKKIDPKTRETMFIEAFINSIHVDYMQQPVMRLIDYILVQIIGVFTAPEGFRDDSNIAVSKLIDQKNQILKNVAQQRLRISQLQKEYIKNEILNPYNMKIQVQVKSPVIDIKQHKDATNFIRVYLGSSQISNKRYLCPKRLLSQSQTSASPISTNDSKVKVFEDQYYILIEDMKIVVVKDQQQLEVCKPFDFNIKVQMLSFSKELTSCFPQEYYDNSITIQSYISPILLKFSNFDYNIIMIGIYHNISYDEGLDQYFIHDFWAQFNEKQRFLDKKNENSNKQAPTIKKDIFQNEKTPVDSYFKGAQMTDSLTLDFAAMTPLDSNMGRQSQSSEQYFFKKNSQTNEINQNIQGIMFSLDFQTISLFTMDFNDIPFAKVTLDNARLIYDSTDGKSKIKIFCQDVDGSFFEKDPQNELFYEYPLIGSLVKMNIHNESQIHDLAYLTKQMNLFAEMKDNNPKSDQDKLINLNNTNKPQFEQTAINKQSEKNIIDEKKDLKGESNSTQILESNFKLNVQNETMFQIPTLITPLEIERDLSTQPDFLYPSIENHLVDLNSGKKNEFATLNQKQNVFEFSSESNDKTGEKEKYLNLHNITIVAQMGILLQIAGFTRIEEETENVPPPIEPIPQVIPKGKEDLGQQQSPQISPHINFEEQNDNIMEESNSKLALNVSNILICTPCMESGNILTLRGQFAIQMQSKQPKSLEELRELIKNGKITREELCSTNVIEEMDVKVEGLEIFICDYNEITHKDFRTVKKREILLPLKIFLISKKFISISDDLKQAIEKSLIDLQVQQSSLRISFQDIKLMQDVINYAITQIEIYNERAIQIQREKQIKSFARNQGTSNKSAHLLSVPSQGVVNTLINSSSSNLNLNKSQSRTILKNSSQLKEVQVYQQQQMLNENSSQQILGKISDVAMIMFNKGQEQHSIQQVIIQSPISVNEQRYSSHAHQIKSKDSSENQSKAELELDEQILDEQQQQRDFKRMESMSKILQTSTVKMETQEVGDRNTFSKKSIIMNEVFKANLKESKINVLIEGFQIVIINDVGNAFTPVLDLMFFDLLLNHSSNIIVDKTNAQIQLGINYFNPKVSEWEPVLERVGLEMNVILNELGTTKQLYTIEPISEHFKCLQINISSQLIFILSKTFRSLQQEILQQEKKVPNYDKDEESLDQKNIIFNKKSSSSSSNLEQQKADNYYSKQKKQYYSSDIVEESERYKKLMKKSLALSYKIHNWEQQRFTLRQDQRQNCPQILENVSHVSPYTVQNQVGHTIEIISDFSYKYDANSSTTKATTTLLNNASTTFRVESKIDHFLKINNRGMTISQPLIHSDPNSLNRSNKVKVSLRTQIFNLSSIKNIDLDKVKCQEIILKINNTFQHESSLPAPASAKNKVILAPAPTFSQGQRINSTVPSLNLTNKSSSSSFQNQVAPQSNRDLKFRVTTEVKLDINQNRKILILSSPYVLQNNTSVEIIVALQFRKYKQLIILQPGQSSAVPIDYLFSQMSVYFNIEMENKDNQDNNNEEESKQESSIEAEEMMKNKQFSQPLSVEECAYGQNFEIKVGTQFILMKIQKDPVNKFKTMMTFDPPYRFKNCLPKPMRLQIISPDKVTSIDRKIYPNEILEEFEYPLFTEVYIKMQLEGFFWSEEQLLLENELLGQIKISDLYNTTSIQIYQNQAKEIKSSKNYYFYSKALLINETQHQLEFYTKGEGRWNSRPILVGGQFPIFQGERLDDNLVLLGEESGNFMVIYDKKCKQKQDKEVSISGVGSTEIQVKKMCQILILTL